MDELNRLEWRALVSSFSLIAAALFSLLLNRLAGKSFREAAGMHWTERARLAWTLRTGAATNIFIIPECAFFTVVACKNGTATEGMLAWGAALVGAKLGAFPLDREILPRLTFRGWLAQSITFWVLILGFLFVLLGGFLAMPFKPGYGMVMVAGAVLLLRFATNAGLPLQLLRLLGIAKPPGERLERIVSDASAKMGLRTPRTWLLDIPIAQAAALPFSRQLLFSTRLMEIASDEELAVVCFHELAHLTESKRVLAGRVVRSLALYPLIFINLLLKAGYLAEFALVALCPLLAISPQFLTRRMEDRADKIATDHQSEAGVYARSLEKIHADGMIPAVVSVRRKTHPHLYDRMLAAGIQPDYPRPAPPQLMNWTTGALMVVLGIAWGLAMAR